MGVTIAEGGYLQVEHSINLVEIEGTMSTRAARIWGTAPSLSAPGVEAACKAAAIICVWSLMASSSPWFLLRTDSSSLSPINDASRFLFGRDLDSISGPVRSRRLVRGTGLLVVGSLRRGPPPPGLPREPLHGLRRGGVAARTKGRES